MRGRPVIDVEYLINRAADDQDIPLDWQSIVDSDIPLHPVATDVESGAAVDLHSTIVDKASLQEFKKVREALENESKGGRKRAAKKVFAGKVANK